MALAASAAGQEKTGLFQLPYKVGLWTPWPEPLPASGKRYEPNLHRPSFTGVEARIVLEKLASIADLFRRLPVLNPPMGFEVHPYRTLAFAIPEVPGPIQSTVGFTILDYFKYCDTCRVRLSVSGPEVYVAVNSIEVISHTREFREDERGPMYRVPRIIGHVAGFPEYSTGAIVLTKIDRPLWVPVTQERFLRNEIRKSGVPLKEAEDSLAQGSTYQQWLRDSEKRKRESEKAYQGIKEFNPKAAEEFREGSERVEREATESLKAGDAREVAQRKESIEFLRRNVRSLEDELASLSPAARAAPAYFLFGGTSPRPSGLTDASAQGAEMIVESNRDFFDRRNSLTSFQLFAVRGLLGTEETLKDCEEGMRQLNRPRHVEGVMTPADPCSLYEKLSEVRRTLDWKRLATFLDEPSAGASAFVPSRVRQP